MSPLHPEFLWAQRSNATLAEKNIIYLTINLPDIQEHTLKVELTSTKFSFSARTGNQEKGIEEKDWAAEVEFYDEIDPENSKKTLTSRHFALILGKKKAQTEFWPRLTKEKGKINFVKTDFSKWVDEDEQEGVIDVPDEDFGDFGGGGGGLGGLGGLGGGLGGGLEGLGGGNPDFDAMMRNIGNSGSGDFGSGEAGLGDDVDSDDDGADGPPPLEDAPEETPAAQQQ